MLINLRLRSQTAFLLLALVYAVALGVLVAGHDVVAFYGDPILYMEGAKDLLSYDSAFHPPLYSGAIALVALVVRDVFVAAKLVSFLSALAVLALTWALGLLCFRRDTVALLAAVLVVLSPVMTSSAYVVSSDMLGAALFLGSVYCLGRASSASKLVAALGGALAGLAYLTRYVYVSIVPAALLYWILAVPGERRGKYLRMLYWTASFVLIIAPWSITCIARHGDLHNMNHVNIAFAMFGGGDHGWSNFGSYEGEYPTLLSLVVAHPLSVLKHFARNAVHFPIEIVLKECLVAGGLLLLGTFSALRKPTVERMALLLNGGMLLLVTLLAWLSRRFVVPLIPVLLLFASYVVLNGIGRSISSYWPTRSDNAFLRKIPVRKLAVALAILAALVTSIVRVPDHYRLSNIHDDKDAGEFLSRNTPKDATLMTSSINLAWYASRARVSMNVLRDVSAGDLERTVRATEASMLAFTERHSAKSFPQLQFLLDPRDPRIPASFRLLYHREGPWSVTAYWIENRG